VTLSWSASSDNVAVAGYRVVRDGVAIATCATTSCTDSSGTIRRTYRYAVAAYDAAGNASELSAAVTVRTGSLPGPRLATVTVRPPPPR